MTKKSTFKIRPLLQRLSLLVLIVTTVSMLNAQTLTELVVPKYIGGKTAASTNNTRTPFAVCIKIDGLTPSTTYDVKATLELPGASATSYGAGNVWNGTAFSGNVVSNAFTTDASGSSGAFWIFYQPTGNGTRFSPGQQHNIRIGPYPTGGSAPSTPLVGSKVITCLDIATTAMTPETTDDGAYIKGSADPTITGKYVLLFDNTAGTGDPLFSYQVRQTTGTQPDNSQLNDEINDIYMQAGTSAIGDYPAIVPIGANNPNGIRRVESRNADNTIYGYNTDADGIWPSSSTLGNTTNMARLDIRYITASDAPLTPAAGVPVVTTSSVSNVTYNSATGGGNVTSQGGSTITARGICWSTSSNPTIADAHTTETGTTGTFTSQMTGLNYNTLYYVRAYATNSQGTGYGNEVSFTTLVPPFPPVVDFVASTFEIVTGQSVDFTDLSTNVPTAWSWSFNGATPMTSNEQNPQNIVYNYAGAFTVCLTASNAYGSNTVCKDAYINVVEPVNAQIVITEIMYNPPESGTDSLEYLELYNNGTEAVNMEGYTFSSGVNYTFPALTFNPGEFLLVSVDSVAIMNTFGKTARQWTSGALSNSGEAVALKDNYGFLIDSLTFDDAAPWDTLADGWGYSLVLCDPNLDNTLGENWGHDTTLIAINTAGDSIWGNPGAGCPQAGDPPVANFEGNPTTVTAGGSVQFTDLSTGDPTTYLWTFEGGTPSTWNTAEPPVITYAQGGTFDVTLTVTNEWGSSTETKTDYIDVIVGIEGRDNRSFSVYPNPSTGLFNIELKGSATLKVYSLLGDVMAQFSTDATDYKLNMTRFEKGVYLLEVEYTDGTKHTQRLVVK